MKKLLLVLSMFMFLPVLSAETYYDYEKIEVEELPTASEDTLNKVYIKGKSYYVTEFVNASEPTGMPLNVDLRGKTLYFNFPDNIAEYMKSTYTDMFPSIFVGDCFNRSIMVTVNDSVSILRDFIEGDYVQLRVVYELSSNGILVNNKSGVVRNSSYSCIFTEVTDSYINSFISTEPFDIVYSWKEVSRNDVYEITVSDDDFYFFFTFEDISNFNVLQDYDLISLSDFQKIVLVLGFNIFFLGFFGLVIYILIKLLNKGISLLFR